MQIRIPQPETLKRRGTLMPALAIAILVAGGAVAFALDALWLSTAQRELKTAADAAALAAGQRMASDDLLRIDLDSPKKANFVREIARNSALLNRAVGREVAVSLDPHVDIRFGRPVVNLNTGSTTFIETDYFPTTVIVATHCDRKNGNPVSLFMPYLTGMATADVTAISEASISNQVSAVRPMENANVPAWPLAILELDGGEQDDWASTIEGRSGQDLFGWDHEGKRIINAPDGIPEIVLRSGNSQRLGNVRIVDINTSLRDEALRNQFLNGWSEDDLKEFGNELGFESGPLTLNATDDFSGMPYKELRQQIGQERVVLLYRESPSTEYTSTPSVLTTRLVSIRLLEITELGDEIELIVQPTVIATRTAVLSEQRPDAPKNPYLYRLAITQ